MEIDSLKQMFDRVSKWPKDAKDGLLRSDQEDVISADEHSIDEYQIHALIEQYVDQETAAQLEDE